MKLFQTLAVILAAEITATLVIRRSTNGKMTVVTNFTTDKGGTCDSLAPFILKGTPEDLDGGFLDAIKTPVETVNGLVSNIEAFQKSAQQAEKNAKTATAKPAAPAAAAAAAEAARKAELEKKRKEAEAKARKENFEMAIAEAKKANAHGNYFTAEALLNLAATLTDDKKAKTDIAKQVKAVAPNKEGFLCNDDEDAARAAVEAFKNAMVKPQVEESPAEQQAEPSVDKAQERETGEDPENVDDNE